MTPVTAPAARGSTGPHRDSPVVDSETVAQPSSFWQRPYVERFLTPLLLPVGVVAGLIAYIINISRIFLAGHGHIPIFVATAITVMILVGAALLSAGSHRLRSSAITLVTTAFLLSIVSSGWLVLGHAQPANTGPTSLSPTLKTAQTLAVTAAPGGTLRFAPGTLTATTGLAKIDVAIAAPGHTFNLHDPSTLAASLSLNAAGSAASEVVFFPKAGTYAFFCAVPSHEANGMKGTITVTGAPMTLPEALKASGNSPVA